jgi:CheY-like chemotaxis protein
MASSTSRDRPLVLVVEEEMTERVALAEHLTDGGYDVVEASDTDEALGILKSNAYVRAIVTDAHVPGQIDGYELARLVREQWSDIATVMTSGHSDATSGPVPSGGEFIVKPYLIEHLLPTLKRMLHRTR